MQPQITHTQVKHENPHFGTFYFFSLCSKLIHQIIPTSPLTPPLCTKHSLHSLPNHSFNILLWNIGSPEQFSYCICPFLLWSACLYLYYYIFLANISAIHNTWQHPKRLVSICLSNDCFTPHVLLTYSFFSLFILLIPTILHRLSISTTFICYPSWFLYTWAFHPCIRVGTSAPPCKLFAHSTLRFFHLYKKLSLNLQIFSLARLLST